MMRLMPVGALLLSALCFTSTVVHAADCVFLRALGQDEVRETADGTSWTSAYATLSDALDAALASGKPIHAAGGIYLFPRLTELTTPLTIYGGFPGISDDETLADRNMALHETVFTGDTALDDVWQHCEPNDSYGLTQTKLADCPIVSNGKLNLPPAFTGDFDTYAPSKNGTNITGAFIVLSGGNLTVDGLTFSGFYNTLQNGVSKSGDAANAVLMFVAGAMNVRNCRFVGNTWGMGAAYTKTNALIEDCDIVYNWGGGRGCGVTQHAGFVTLRRCRFDSIVRTGNTSTQVISCWSGSGFDLFDCSFARCVLAMGSSYNGNYGGPANIFGGEGGGRANFQNCVISNCYTACSHANGLVMMGGRGYWHMNRCVVANNLGVCKPTSGKAYCLFGQISDTSKTRRVYESTTFVGNEMRAQSVAATSGGYALGLLGSNVAGSDTQLLNCTFDDNRAVAPDKVGVEKVLCRGVVTYAATAESTAQTGLANCTFTGTHVPGVFDVAQFGAGHTKELNLVNCIFDAATDGMTDPVYSDVPSLVHFIDSSILNCLIPNSEMNYEGLAYDKVPLVKTVVDPATGRYVYVPGAKVPLLRETCSVATNHTTLPMSWVFRRPGTTTWEPLASTTGKNGSAWDGKIVVDATGASRPADAFTRGAVQPLTEAAETGKSLVLRREPFAAARLTGPVSQAVVPDAAIEPVLASSADPDLYAFAGWETLEGTRVSTSATLEGLDLTEETTVLVARFVAPDVKITFDLGACGVFTASGTSRLTIELSPGAVFPPVPVWTADADWHFIGFDTPQAVPTSDTTYRARYVSSALRRIHVTPTGAGQRDGTDWANAYAADQLAEAYADAGSYRGEVWLAGGRYLVRSPITMRPNVTVRGGFAGTETSAEAADPVAHQTIIDGDVNDDNFWQRNNSTAANDNMGRVWTVAEDGTRTFNTPNPDNADSYWTPNGNRGDNALTAFVNAVGNATNNCFAGLVFTGFDEGAVLATSGLSQGLRLENCSFLGTTTSLPNVEDGMGTVRVVNSPATMVGCVFDGCRNAVMLGNVAAETSAFVGCRFENCTAGNGGAGGIRPYGKALVAVTNCMFRRCYISGHGFQGGGAVSLRSTSGTQRVVDCQFVENLTVSSGHGSFVLSGANTAVLERCRFVGNRLNNTAGDENRHSACLSHYNGQSAVLVRDCYFKANTMRSTMDKDSCYPASVLSANGPVTFVNTTILDSTNDVAGVATRGGTISSVEVNVALVNCVVKDTVDLNGTMADLRCTKTPTIAVINSVMTSSDANYKAIIAADSAWTPTIANSYVQGFDRAAYEPLKANGYLYEVVSEGGAMVKETPEAGANGAIALRVGATCPVKARPVWLSDTTVYFYDADANAAKPWRKVIDRTSYAASVTGLSLTSPCIPDAFGTPRRHVQNRTRFTCGPLYTPNGLLLFVR